MRAAVAGALALAVICLAQTERLARWKSVPMPFHGESLSARERQMVDELVNASRLLDHAFWRQSDLAGYALYRSTADPTLKSLLGIMGGRWDLTDDNRVFTGNAAMPPGHAMGAAIAVTSSSTFERTTTYPHSGVRPCRAAPGRPR